jgi:hypothetical protein
MCGCVHETKGLGPRDFSALVVTIALSILLGGHLWAQSPSTGALIGRTLDRSGAAIPGVKIQIMRRDTDVTLTATSDEQGRFGFQLLAPGNYGLQAVMPSFDPLQLADINISVTETLRIELHLHLGAVAQHVEVRSELPMVQTEDSALGRAVYGAALTGLPLVTRNYAQIAGLSPGVISGVFNAGSLVLAELHFRRSASPTMEFTFTGRAPTTTTPNWMALM